MIGLGFHICIDYELVWDGELFQTLCLGLRKCDLGDYIQRPSSLKDMLIDCLLFMKDGKGGEILPESDDLCRDFSSFFSYKPTIGGTAARAALAISKISIPSSLYMCVDSRTIREMLPKCIIAYPPDQILALSPHVILQYPGNYKFSSGDISFSTKNPNRIMISNDVTSSLMRIPKVSPDPQINVFLLSSFSEVLEKEVLERALRNTLAFLDKLSPDTWIVLEDAHYPEADFHEMVLSALKDKIRILSMNEEELQEIAGTIPMNDMAYVAKALDLVRDRLEIRNLLVHTKHWAVVSGPDAKRLRKALHYGVTMASARFEKGDDITKKDLDRIAELPPERNSFYLEDENLCCFPSYDMNHVTSPVTVGLGDAFAGGFVYGISLMLADESSEANQTITPLHSLYPGKGQ